MPFSSSKPDRLAGRSLSLSDADRAPKGQGRSLRPFSAVRTSAVGNPRVVVVICNNKLAPLGLELPKRQVNGTGEVILLVLAGRQDLDELGSFGPQPANVVAVDVTGHGPSVQDGKAIEPIPPPVSVPQKGPRPRRCFNGFRELCHPADSG